MPLVALADLPALLPQGGPLLGVDLGTKTLGLAVADPAWQLATPLASWSRQKFTAEAAALEALITERQVQGLVVGVPRQLDGSSTAMTQRASQWMKNLAARPGWETIPLASWDERWSTLVMERELIALDTSRAKRATLIDAMAAQYILQGALDYLAQLPPPDLDGDVHV